MSQWCNNCNDYGCPLCDHTGTQPNAPETVRDVWTIEAGRGLCRDGVRVVTITRKVGADGRAPMSPTTVDALTRRIAALLNLYGEE